uniref:Uncharacterized protein n=1 Tax=Arion vulgaris TaxID=1028688 RepID=A0A0B6YNL4_9EUPU
MSHLHQILIKLTKQKLVSNVLISLQPDEIFKHGREDFGKKCRLDEETKMWAVEKKPW